ncbi:hypothetical protein BDP55DRAFT_650822 [Colletotrichum godetiae]|uniref:Secreted protein n=1 Tax=Colletotrichum godetiae TaxID=1209918 RepID=A0AAJ0F2G5_9PEZI|nr:uncharacterized protein BDP55DRAFT_650822 [Colletotrichum godetiae]KAK1690462.1 hypothetical protein BDP55DRAFT_650822 [Colletotrichum godetiae]
MSHCNLQSRLHLLLMPLLSPWTCDCYCPHSVSGSPSVQVLKVSMEYWVPLHSMARTRHRDDRKSGWGDVASWLA